MLRRGFWLGGGLPLLDVDIGRASFRVVVYGGVLRDRLDDISVAACGQLRLYECVEQFPA